MKNSKFLRSKNLLKSLKAEELKCLNSNDERRWIATQPAVARNDGRSGFSLVELVIVIAIVIILSVVSVPIYRGYTRQAKMSEAYAIFGAILSSEKAYYSQYGHFLCGHQASNGLEFSCQELTLGIDLRGNKYFTAFRLAGLSAEGIKEGFSAGVIKPEELIVENGKDMIKMTYNLSLGTVYKDDVSSQSGFKE